MNEWRQLVAELVETSGTAFCYDRYSHDDDWTYCIFCQEGDFDPWQKAGWQHAPDCLVLRARALLERTGDL